MQDDELRDLATEIAMARRKGEVVPDRAAWPGDVAEAYRLQELATAAYRDEGCGWKVGATNDSALTAMKLDQPFLGPMVKSHAHESGASIALPAGAKGVECEIAFRLKSDLPSKEGGHDRGAVEAAIGSVHPAIEVVGSRIDGPWASGLHPIGDFGGNVAFIWGDGVEDWQDLDLAAETVLCHKNGEQAAEGKGSIVMGDPWNSLVWLTRQGIALKAGDFVSTGTMTGLTPAAAGDGFEAKFSTIGSVAVAFTG